MLQAMMIAALAGQAAPPRVLPHFPGCPPEAVSSLCAPPPPPPPRHWDDPALEEVLKRALADYWRLTGAAAPLRVAAFAAQKDIAGQPIGSPDWERQRQRMVRVLAVEKELGALRLRMIVTGNEHRATASAGDIAAIDRCTAMIDAGRQRRAIGDRTILADLIDRPVAR